MGKRKRGGGNPLAKGLSRVLDKASGQVIDGIIEVGASGKSTNKTSRSPRDTDWATRAPAPPRKHRSR